MDALVAEQVMGLVWDASRCRVCGWELAPSLDAGCVAGNCSMRPAPMFRADKPAPYSTDIAVAWQVVERLIALGFYPDIVTTHTGEGGGLAWRCVIDRCTDCVIGRGADDEDALDPFPVSESALTAPLAICLAALEAVGVFALDSNTLPDFDEEPRP